MDQLKISLPKGVENLQLPAPTLIIYYKNLENRVLWLDSDVDEYWLEYVRNILEWNREDKDIPPDQRKPIKLMLFSDGGELDVSNALIDTIKLSRTPIWSVNTGSACSAACYINVACHKRLAFPNASYLLHQGSGEFQGTYEQVVAAVFEYQRKIDKLSKFLLENTRIPKEVLEENISTEWYMDASTALELGVCDEIIENLDDIL